MGLGIFNRLTRPSACRSILLKHVMSGGVMRYSEGKMRGQPFRIRFISALALVFSVSASRVIPHT
jgi:hypothetical protein